MTTPNILSIICIFSLLSACGGKVNDNTSSQPNTLSSTHTNSSSSLPSADSGPNKAEISAHFAKYPCGVDFSAWGSSWETCFRTPGGGAKCLSSSSDPLRTLTWSESGQPVSGVARIYAGGIKGAVGMLISDSGQVFSVWSEVYGSTPIINSGAIFGAVAYREHCVVVNNQTKRDVLCYFDGDGSDIQPVKGLPDDFYTAQLAGSLGTDTTMCALNTLGQAWCWGWWGDDALVAKPVELNAPVKSIFFDDVGLCGVTFSGAVLCEQRTSAIKSNPGTVYAVRFSNRIMALQDTGEVIAYAGQGNSVLATKNIVALAYAGLGDNYVQTENGNIYKISASLESELVPNAKAEAAECLY